MTSLNEEDCPACFGTKQDNAMHSPRPMRKILYTECSFCKGTGKQPKSD
jgi:DnaJ-class molecular chaperone